MSAECEIDINGKPCGVQAIGRCATCGKAFCATHQARTAYNPPNPIVSYVDMCAICFPKSPGEVARVEAAKRKQEWWDAEKYFQEGTARNDLLASGVQPVNLYITESVWQPKKSLFGTGNELVEMATLWGCGWILGEFQWKWQPIDSWEHGRHLTVLLDVVPQQQLYINMHYSHYGTLYLPWGLAAVEPYSGGYKLLDKGFDDSYQELRLAVKRLVGKES